MRAPLIALLLLAAVAAAFIILTNKTNEAPEPSSQDTLEETSQTPATLNTPTPLLSIEGKVLSALLAGDTFIAINLTQNENTLQVTLLSYSLSKQRESARIDLTSLCNSTHVEYRSLGLSQSKTWAYHQLRCPREATSAPLLIAFNLEEGTLHPVPAAPGNVVALGEGAVIVKEEASLTALDVENGGIMWSRDYLSGYVFPGSNRVFQGVLKAGIMRDSTLLAVFTDRELSETPLHVACVVKADARGIREACLEHHLPRESAPLYLDTWVSYNAEGRTIYLLTTAFPTHPESPSILWLHTLDTETLTTRGEWKATLKGVDPGQPVLLFTDEKGATIVLGTLPDPSQPHGGVGGLAIRVGVEGVEKWRRSLAEGERVLHAVGESLFIYRDGTLYVASSTGPLKPVAWGFLTEPQVNTLGLVLPAVFFPLVLLQEVSGPPLYSFQGDTLYNFDGRTLYKTTLIPQE